VERLAEEALEFLFALPETTIYLAVGILCWAEAAFFLGFVTPGEIAVATGGVLASRGQVSLAWLAMVAVTGTVAGNTTGYLLGRRWGTPMMAWGPLQRLVGPAVEKTREFMARRGEWAIVLGRLATVTRIVVPFLAGASRLSYRRFLLFDLPATAAWATTWAVLGFALGESWEVLLEVAGTAAVFVLILFVTALVIRWVAVRIAANQKRVQAAFRLFLTVTGLRGVARFVAPAVLWVMRRFDPRVATGLNLTMGFLVLVAAVGGVGLVLGQTRAVQGLVLFDFPVLEWMVARRTDEAVEIARAGLRAFHWPGILFVALPLAAFMRWKVGTPAAVRIVLGVVGAAAGAYFLDRHILEGVVPRAEFPSVPVAVAAALLTHTTVTVARRWGWGPSVATAGVGTFVVFTVALATVVAGWAAPSGIVLGFALGMAWAAAVELPRIMLGPEGDEITREDVLQARRTRS
jgi:membrane protein DedA with SNARE-associated domain